MQGITEASTEWNSDTMQPPRILVINHLKRDFVLSLQTFLQPVIHQSRYRCVFQRAVVLVFLCAFNVIYAYEGRTV